jgi:hypothetical protein
MKTKERSLLTEKQSQDLEGLETTLNTICRHWNFLRRSNVDRGLNEDLVAYRNAPSDENFEKLKATCVEFDLFFGPQNTGSRITGGVSIALEELKNEARERFEPIVKTALETARANLNQIKESENARHKESFGHDLHPSQPTPVIESAAGRVAELEAILRTFDGPGGPEGYKKVFAALRAL